MSQATREDLRTDHAHGELVHELSQHESHHLQRHSRPSVLQHLSLVSTVRSHRGRTLSSARDEMYTVSALSFVGVCARQLGRAWRDTHVCCDPAGRSATAHALHHLLQLRVHSSRVAALVLWSTGRLRRRGAGGNGRGGGRGERRIEIGESEWRRVVVERREASGMRHGLMSIVERRRSVPPRANSLVPNSPWQRIEVEKFCRFELCAAWHSGYCGCHTSAGAPQVAMEVEAAETQVVIRR